MTNTGTGASTVKSSSSYWATRTPKSLLLTIVSTTSNKIDWEAVGTGYDGFSIERSENFGAFSELTTVSAVTETYTDDTCTVGLAYWYRVRAYKGTHYSDYTIPVSNLLGDSAYYMVGGWKSNELTGTNIDDYAGGNDGTMSGCTWADDGVRPALVFDGVAGSDTVKCGDILDTTFAGANKKFTITAWIKPAAAMTNGMIVTKYSATSGAKEFVFRVYTDSKLGFHWTGAADGSTYRSYLANTPITNTAKWYFVTVVYDGTQALNSRVKLYVDAIDDNAGVSASAGTPASIQDTTTQLAIGSIANHDGTTNYNFNGNICLVRIYSCAKRYQDILAIKYMDYISLASTTTADFVGVAVKGANNPIISPANLQFYPPEIVLVDNVYYSFAKSGGDMYSYYSNNKDTNWGNGALKLNRLSPPAYFSAVSKYETECLIKKDDTWYLFFGTILNDGSAYHASIGVASCATINGSYSYGAAVVIASESNDTLTDLGITFNHISNPEIVKVGSTYHWFFTMMYEDTSSLWSQWYIVHGVSPEADWLNITFTKILFHSGQVNSILSRFVSYLGIPRVFYHNGYYYMLLQASTGNDLDAINNQAGVYIARSLTIDGFEINSIQKTAILDSASGTAGEWDFKRTYGVGILRDNETKLTPILSDGKLQLYYSGLNRPTDATPNHGLPGFAELTL